MSLKHLVFLGKIHRRSPQIANEYGDNELICRIIFNSAGSFGKSGSSDSCRLFLHFLGKIAVQEMSGRTPGSPRRPSSRHPRFPGRKANLQHYTCFTRLQGVGLFISYKLCRLGSSTSRGYDSAHDNPKDPAELKIIRRINSLSPYSFAICGDLLWIFPRKTRCFRDTAVLFHYRRIFFATTVVN